MSLTAPYVIADDGLFYRDPDISGQDWYICFDDEEPPELVVAVAPNYRATAFVDMHACVDKADGILASLRDQGLKVRIMGYNGLSGRFFCGVLDECRTAASWYLELLAPVPRKLIKGEAAGVSAPGVRDAPKI